MDVAGMKKRKGNWWMKYRREITEGLMI